MPWTSTASGLPKDGDDVDFVVDGRAARLSGRYEQCMFKSRWAHYSPVEVREWRRARESVEAESALMAARP